MMNIGALLFGASVVFAQQLPAPQGLPAVSCPAAAGIAASLPSNLALPAASPLSPVTLTGPLAAVAAPVLRVQETAAVPSALPVEPLRLQSSRQVRERERTERERTVSAALDRAQETVRAEWGAPPLDQLLSDSDVLLLGESHHSLSSLRWLAGSLPRMKAAGVRYVGLEWVSETAEEHINAYLDGEEDYLPMPALGAVRERHAYVEELFKAMKETGLRVLGLTQPEVMWLREMGRRAAKNLGVPESEFMEGAALHRLGRLAQGEADRVYEKGVNEAIAEVGITLRNEFMARVFKERLAPGEKAVALVGYDHLEYPEGTGPETLYSVPAARYGDLSQALKGAALRAFSLMLTGGAFDQPEHLASDLGLRAKLYRFLGRILGEERGGGEAYARVSDRVGVYRMGGASGAELGLPREISINETPLPPRTP